MNEERKKLVRKLMGDIDRAAHGLKHTESEAEIAEKCEQLRIMATSVLKSRSPRILQPAIRQYRHNSREGFIIGYDTDETDKIVDGLVEEIKLLEMAAITKGELCITK